MRVLFKDGKTSEKSIGEFYFTPDDTTVQFRLASSADSSLTSYRNMERAEMIRKQLVRRRSLQDVKFRPELSTLE